MGIWSFWLILGVGFLIAEVLTVSTTCLYIGTGALLAMCASFLGGGWLVTVITFIVSTVILYLLTYRWRTKLLKMLSKGASHAATGMDALIGRTGQVEISDMPRIRIDGDNWQIRSSSPDIKFQTGETVRVVGYDSIILIVEIENRE